MTSPRAPHTPELRSALTDESGFTLVELFVTVAILGVLLAFAVPAYLSFRGKAQSTAARSEVREVIPSANAYYLTNGNFTGMSSNALRSGYDSGLTISNGSSTDIVYAKPEGDGQAYCISAFADGHWAHHSGPEARSSPTRTRSPRTPAPSRGC